MLNWTANNVFVLGETEFRVGGTADEAKSSGNEFLLFKPKWMVEQYLQLIADLRPQHIVELGIYRGGSVAFLSLLAKPRKHVAVELRQQSSDRLDAWLDAHDLRDVVRPYYGIDQSDHERLEKLVADEFGDSPLDLVIDDASHLFEPTLASFNVLFPRLRPGGIYVIEDWAADLELESRIAHDATMAEAVRREVEQRRQSGNVKVPLTRLVFEIILAAAYTELIEDIYIRRHWLVVKRGSGNIEGDIFDITACLLHLGRRLLSLQ